MKLHLITPVLLLSFLTCVEVKILLDFLSAISNQTLVVTINHNTHNGTSLSHLHVEIDPSERAVKNYELNTIKLEELPMEYKIKDMKYLRTLADEALDNDPVVGTSGFMPMTRTITRSNW